MTLIQLSSFSSSPRAPWQCEAFARSTHPPERVWAALTSESELAAWWCDAARIDLRQGGTWSFSGRTVFDASLFEAPSPTETPSAGDFEILESTAPERLRVRWNLGGLPTELEWQLTSHLEQTEICVTQRAPAPFAWVGSDVEPNWITLALSLLIAHIEEGCAPLRLDYERAAQAEDRLRLEVAVSTFPWIVWTKLTQSVEQRRWWHAAAELVPEAAGAFRLGDLERGPRRVLEIGGEGNLRLVHDFERGDECDRVLWEVDETDDDTLVRVTVDGPVQDAGERVRRAIYWTCTLLDLCRYSTKGVSSITR